MRRMGDMSIYFTSLIAEAILLPRDAFDKYFDEDQHHKLKIVKYPDLGELGKEGQGQGQGVGPHKDSMLSSYLLQASEHRGLQVQNVKGEWIDCPPVPGTVVVAIGQGLEALTQGVCVSTTHRVLSPAAGSGPRFSIPFFQGVDLDTDFDKLEKVGVGAVPDRIKEQRRRIVERNGGRLDDVEFTFRTGVLPRRWARPLCGIGSRAIRTWASGGIPIYSRAFARSRRPWPKIRRGRAATRESRSLLRP
uniref:Fe2OG dioxygenase domain-containing protein n=1 Tax=Bionectria ochroleuca TaxID=29856 RepID=A0A8H7TJ79_BIOOC